MPDAADSRAAVPAADGMLRVACLQMRLGASLDEAERGAAALARRAAAAGAALALLPEYWFMPAAGPGREEAAPPAAVGAAPTGASGGRLPSREEVVSAGAWAREALFRIAQEAAIAVGGNALVEDDDGLWNALLVVEPGGLVVAEQRKTHPMPTEVRWGVGAWAHLVATPWRDVRLGALVCADVLHPEAARVLALQGAEVVLNPVMSYGKPRDPTREARKAMFVARAYDNACFVLKAGSVGRTGRAELVGRSLVAAPWGLVAEARDERGEEVVIADLDLLRLRDERRRSLSLPQRRPNAYLPLVDQGPHARLPAEPARDEPAFDVG